MSGTAGLGRSSTAKFEETLRDFWANRPVRPQRGGKIAGVCEAIGLRYGIDPVLVRIVFVVGAFYTGAGLVLYLLGWLLLPKEDDTGGANAGKRSTSAVVALAVILLLIPAVMWAMRLEGLIGLVIGFGAVYLLHRNYRERGVGAPPRDAVATADNTWVYPGASAPQQPLNDLGQDVRTRPDPPAWDPLGAAPFAWDLPEPSEPQPEPAPARPKRRWVTLVTLGIAAFVGAMSVTAANPLSFTFALTLAVLGAGMIIGAFLHAGRGLIGFAIPVAALAVVMAAIPVGGPWRGVEDMQRTFETVEEVGPHYATSVGNIELHMDDMAITTGQNLRTSAEVELGAITVYVPRNADVTAKCTAGQGIATCLGQERTGQDARIEGFDAGPDGPGGGNIDLDLRAGAGSVEVIRD
ncbi:PspC domain-containing protein [Saccharopolyspora erythraea]|uniref:PspC domain-containing protein n=1 Tax=Saccharopolyspora erythraea TaxID=1836 RepID=UPI0020126507|nr:PspC domain-containing protein [Saccharopolyspora erythraea]